MTVRPTVNSTDEGPARRDSESGEIAKHRIDGEWIESDTVSESIKQATGGVLYRLDSSISPGRIRALRTAGIELDQIARTASRDGRQLDLSTKEFGVLEALLKASPIPVSAENRTNPVRTPHQLGREADGIARSRRQGDLR